MRLIFMTEEQAGRHVNNIVLGIEIYIAFPGLKSRFISEIVTDHT